MKNLFGITDTGKVRDNNEDVFIAEEVRSGQFIIAGVIDGVGGYEGGEVAAALTREVVLAEMATIGADVPAQLEIAFNLANEEIFARKLEDQKLSAMACVATVAVIDRLNNLLHYIHVGDTRLYLFRDHSLIKLSSDQSPVGFLEDSGRITEEAAMQHPKRNIINQALGLGSQEEMSDSYFETGSSPFLPGDLILVCSDGLTDMINKEVIARVLDSSGTLQARAEKLIAEANAAGGNDNITVVLALNDKAPVSHPVSRPAADLFSQAANEVPELKAPVSPAVQEIPPSEVNQRNNPFVKKEPSSGVLAGTNQGSDNVTQQNKTPGGNQTLVIILSALCLLFLASTAWLFFTNPPVKLKPSGTLNPAPAVTVNLQEKQLIDTLSKLKGDTLILSAGFFKSPVHLSRALNINRDTLIIKTKGDLIFQRDSAYKGPAMILSPACKYVVIDQLVLENFETGIVSYKNVLDLKNVKFNNCKYPLQILFEFPDRSFINGRISKRAFQADTLAKK